jgi:two-component system KDP operon response regulator KdpE
LEGSKGADGLHSVERYRPDVILLDIELPDADGLELIRSIRKRMLAPIVVVSAQDREEDKVAALDAGANDFVSKPFGADELMARIRVALRGVTVGVSASARTEFRSGELTVDLVSRRVFVSSHEVRLTPTEFRLLHLFIESHGRVLTYEEVLREVWGEVGTEHQHYVRVYMAQLRQKVERNSDRPKLFRTETGLGYRFLGDDN